MNLNLTSFLRICKKNSVFFCLLSLFVISKTFAWTPLDTLKIKEVGKIAISKNENQIAYEVSAPHVSLDSGKWETEVNIYNIEKSETKKTMLTGYVPNSIEWFPSRNFCEDSLLFLAKSDNKTRICRYFIDTNRTEILFEESRNITGFSASHSGNKIAFLVLSNSPTHKYFEVVEETLPKNKLYLLDLSTSLAELLPIEDSVTTLNWSFDDKFIVFDHQPSTKIEDKVLYSKISKIDILYKKISCVADDTFSNFNPQFSPDGKYIAFVTGPGTWEFTFHIKIANLEGATFSLAATPDEQVDLIGWLPDSSSVLVSERYHTIQRLYRLAINQRVVEALTPSNTLILQPKLSPQGNLIAYRGESPDQPAEVYISRLPYNPTQISHIQLADYTKIDTRIISWKTSDGKQIEGLLTLPSNRSTEPFPLLVLIKGHSSIYLNTYEGGIHLAKTPYSIGVFADQGYAVLRPLFRGSSGYGRLMRNSIEGDWGGKDFDDLMEGIDFLVENKIADPTRLGIMGWSYGGFMTANAITKTNRFKAASAGGALVNFISYAGTSDLSQFLPHYMRGWYWENPEKWQAYSPINHVKKINTPTLIQHSSGDKRVPASQGYELYKALKFLKVPTKMVLYSDSGHSLSNPKILIEGMNHNLEWFNLWLKN